MGGVDLGVWGADPVALNDVWSSVDGVEWTQTTESASWPPRSRGNGLSIDGKIWLMGGNAPNDPTFSVGCGLFSSSDGVNWNEVVGPSGPCLRADKPQLIHGRLWLYNFTGSYVDYSKVADSLHCLADRDCDETTDDADNCVQAYNPRQLDVDADGLGDTCDADDDADDVPDDQDNCSGVANPEQIDLDRDGLGDLCDGCPRDSDADQADEDGDGKGDACDIELTGRVVYHGDATGTLYVTLQSVDGSSYPPYSQWVTTAYEWSAATTTVDFAVSGPPGTYKALSALIDTDGSGPPEGGGYLDVWADPGEPEGTQEVFFELPLADPTARFEIALEDTAGGADLDDDRFGGGGSGGGCGCQVGVPPTVPLTGLPVVLFVLALGWRRRRRAV